MAIKAGRVGVRPDQVDDTGKIIINCGGVVDGYTKEQADEKFATKSALSTGLAGKVNTSTYTAGLAEKADKTELDNYIDTETYTDDMSEINTAIASKASGTDVAEALALKADKSTLTANDNQFIFAYDAASQKYGYKAGGADTFHPFSAGGGGFDVKIVSAGTDTILNDVIEHPTCIYAVVPASVQSSSERNVCMIFDHPEEHNLGISIIPTGTVYHSSGVITTTPLRSPSGFNFLDYTSGNIKTSYAGYYIIIG